MIPPLTRGSLSSGSEKGMVRDRGTGTEQPQEGLREIARDERKTNELWRQIWCRMME